MPARLATYTGARRRRRMTTEKPRRRSTRKRGPRLVKTLPAKSRSTQMLLSNDPLLIEKVRDIVGFYMNPPDRGGVLRRREDRRFRPWTARSRSCRCAPARSSGGRTTTYGTARPRCSPRSTSKTGEAHRPIHRRHRAIEFRQFLDAIDAAVPADSTSTSSWTTTARTRPPLIRNWFAEAPAFSCALHARPTARGSTWSSACSPS